MGGTGWGVGGGGWLSRVQRRGKVVEEVRRRAQAGKRGHDPWGLKFAWSNTRPPCLHPPGPTRRHLCLSSPSTRLPSRHGAARFRAAKAKVTGARQRGRVGRCTPVQGAHPAPNPLRAACALPGGRPAPVPSLLAVEAARGQQPGNPPKPFGSGLAGTLGPVRRRVLKYLMR